MKNATVWAPNAQFVELVDAAGNSFSPPVVLQPASSSYKGTVMSGYWTTPPDVAIPLADGDGYWFKIKRDDDTTHLRIDPYARAMKHSQAHSIYKDPSAFRWTDENFRPPSFESMIIYQVFPGGYCGKGDQDWISPTGQNYHFNVNLQDFEQLTKKLDYIRSLGVNTLQILPLNEYSGDDYLGYSSVSFFAVESSYGSVIGDGSSYTELKNFINEAHARGLAVLADVVFNHIGKVGDSGPLWNYDSVAKNIYFSGEDASNQCGGSFGMAPDWARYEVQKYIHDSCLYYLEELHFDGLRFDFTSQIVNRNAGSGINSGKEVLRNLIWDLKQKHPSKIFICEHWGESSGDYEDWMVKYGNFDSGWYGFHRRMHEALKPFASGREHDIAEAINGGSYDKSYNRVIYANSHDECWWDGMNPKSKYYLVSEFNGWRGDDWSQRKARMMHALSFFVPGIPMFFQGDCFAMEGCFNDSHPECFLDWSLEKVHPGPAFLSMFRTLCHLKRTYAPLCQAGSSFEWLQYPKDGWFAFKRKHNADVLIVAGNYQGEDFWNYSVPTNGETGNWTQIFNSNGQEYGGDGMGNYLNDPNSNNGWMTINIPKNGIVVMSRTSI